jgi:hypothetical protein
MPAIKRKRPFQNILNRKFGYLTITGESELRGLRRFWPVACKCGTQKWVEASSLLSGVTVSCGCWKDNAIGNRNRTHGLSRDVTYKTWSNMIHRCYDTKNNEYKNYGGRGIRICQFLQASPANLINLIGSRPSGKVIDRIDNNGNYSCGSCKECFQCAWTLNIKWSTAAESARNRRTNIWITHEGRTQIAQDWAKELGISHDVVVKRFRHGQLLTQDSKYGRSVKMYLTLNGETKSAKEWSKVLNIPYATIWYRVKRGIPFHEPVI